MSFEDDVYDGERFEFGKNWQSFVAVLNDERIAEAARAICDFLGVEDLVGRTFLDVGSGSGLSSLAARQLGARVRSFDYDTGSVDCTRELKRRYYPGDAGWDVEQGSILDRRYLDGLGRFDVCHAWGVLHHTDSLWQALFNAHLTVRDGGLLFIAVYNDQGIASAAWEVVKRTYCSGRLARALVTSVFYPAFFASGLAIDTAHLRNPARRYREHVRQRGMSLVHDWKDWLGGYPYERARPQRVTAFFENLGYELRNFKPAGIGFGNNQFLFQKGVDRTSEARPEPR